MRILSQIILLVFTSVLVFSAPEPVYAQGNMWKRFSGACRKWLPSPKKTPTRKEVLQPENMEKIPMEQRLRPAPRQEDEE